ncbi:transcription factor bHLH146-like [Gastrolobium bilobum]|uniref:transcription factor bHLH146-like n=1 Tax=Gastrolobium bilobum TaxID=150636 RepID=UPI002AB2A84E|nr:transcription factor bHLH146-like [Gastrolobium bilobum]
MEGPAKRRRVYSLEPNKVVQAKFTRNYVNYLVPALTKIKERGLPEQKNHCEFQNVVKYEVDKAMVFSAQGFAWSNALKIKLQRERVNVDSSTSFGENEMVPLDFSSSPSSESQSKISVNKSKHNDMAEMKKDLNGQDDEDEVINDKLRSLRKLIPGGDEICNEQMVEELESYISCLQMQVNILQCLSETS